MQPAEAESVIVPEQQFQQIIHVTCWQQHTRHDSITIYLPVPATGRGVLLCHQADWLRPILRIMPLARLEPCWRHLHACRMHCVCWSCAISMARCGYHSCESSEGSGQRNTTLPSQTANAHIHAAHSQIASAFAVHLASDMLCIKLANTHTHPLC